MKFISSHDEHNRLETEQELYNLHGILIDSEDEKVFSKIIGNKYLIRTLNNVPFDPYGPEAGRQIWNRTEMRPVSKATFQHYNTYLGTKNKKYLTMTNRSYING